MIKLVQGNSWWRDYSSNVTSAFSSDWATSSWAIAAADTDFTPVSPYTVLSFGLMAVSASTTHLEVRIPSTATVLPAGNYVIALQFKNTATGFCQEQHLPLMLLPQVIT